MNFHMIRPKKRTEDVLLSFTKNCEILIKQTHTRPQELFEFRLTKPKETFSFPPFFNVGLVCNWMIGLTSFEVYNSVFNITEENNKFELFTDNFDEFSFFEPKDELEEILNTSDITPSHLQHEINGPRATQTYKKLR